MALEAQLTGISNMIGIGDKLREARERKNLTIGQAQKQTRIHSTVLKALEDGNCDSVLNPTYVKSFLRKYSDFLGLDSHQMLKEYLKIHPETETKAINKLSEPEGHSNSFLEMIPAIKLVTLVVISIIVAAFVAGKAITHLKKPGAQKRAPIVALSKTSKKASVKSATAKKDTMSVSIPQNVQLKLLLKVNQNVYIKMKTDGNVIFEHVLSKGTTEIFTANNSINIYAAKGEYIELILNGKSLGSPGKGVLKNIEITRSGVRIK